MQISHKCSIAIHCLIFIHEYGKENKVTSELLALSTGCNPVTVRNILSAMKKAGIISVRFGTGGATLAMPCQDISLYRICSAVDPEAIDKMIRVHPSPSAFCPVGRNIGDVLEHTYAALKESVTAGMKAITLESMVNDYHALLDGEESEGSRQANRKHPPHDG